MALGEALLGGLGSVVSGLFGKSSAEKQAKRQEQLQRDFAQKGIQWKVKDAKKAGIHPLAALGANTISYSPITTGTPDLGLGQLGQDVGRAIDAGSTQNQRTASLQTRIAEAQLKGLELDNAGKAIQNSALASQNVLRSQAGPAMAAVSGATNSGVPGQNSPYIVGGASVTRNPNFSDAQVIEDRHGDVAAAGYGLLTIPADAYATVMKSPNFRRALAETAPYRAMANSVATGYARSLIPRNKPYPLRRSSYSGGGW